MHTKLLYCILLYFYIGWCFAMRIRFVNRCCCLSVIAFYYVDNVTPSSHTNIQCASCEHDNKKKKETRNSNEVDWFLCLPPDVTNIFHLLIRSSIANWTNHIMGRTPFNLRWTNFFYGFKFIFMAELKKKKNGL